MSTSTEVTKGQTEAELALMSAQEDEFDAELLTAPILKVGQGLTREVTSGDAEAGEFINTLTGETYGTKVGFIIAFYNKGRFAADDSGRGYVAWGDEIPEQWGPLVGEEWVGTLFREYPDAEEKYKERVNAKEIEWGKGPQVSTTHNFTGLVLAEGEDGEEEAMPVRLSLKRTDVPTARKIITLKRAVLRNAPFWDVVFDLHTEKREKGRQVYYNLVAKTGRKTTADEKAFAIELAQAVNSSRVVSNEDAVVDKKAEPKNTGGLDVG